MLVFYDVLKSIYVCLVLIADYFKSLFLVYVNLIIPIIFFEWHKQALRVRMVPTLALLNILNLNALPIKTNAPSNIYNIYFWVYVRKLTTKNHRSNTSWSIAGGDKALG